MPSSEAAALSFCEESHLWPHSDEDALAAVPFARTPRCSLGIELFPLWERRRRSLSLPSGVPFYTPATMSAEGRPPECALFRSGATLWCPSLPRVFGEATGERERITGLLQQAFNACLLTPELTAGTIALR